MKKILFILKKRHIYSNECYTTTNSGLFNSATFVNDMLVKNGVESHLEQVVDNNEIDKYVTKYRPDVVIIEALWVVPSKMEILKKIHPNVTWIIRLHSELPFLANEGIAIKWLKEYVKYDKVLISSNSTYLIDALNPFLDTKILYQPNYYPVNLFNRKLKTLKSEDELNIGLFGAIRPLKNSLTQAVAAINYANKKNKVLNLHINTARVEQKGENVLVNLRELFKDSKHNLIEHGWLKHSDFLDLVSTMDLCLQVSLTETYNIVAADSINVNVPIITSREITFVNYFSKVKLVKNVNEMVTKIELNLKYKLLSTIVNKILLLINSNKSKSVWLDFVLKQKC